MSQRDQERKNVKVFRLNVVAGILNKFYSSWHLKKSRESLLFETQNLMPESNLFIPDYDEGLN